MNINFKKLVIFISGLFFSISFLVNPNAVLANSQGPKSPTTIVNDRTGTAFTNPGYAASSDTSYATVLLGAFGISQYLKATDFGFSIPKGATINGIEVEVAAFGDNVNIYENGVNLVKGGVGTGNTRATKSSLGTTNAYFTEGSSTYLWGTSWTADDINSTGFGAAFSCYNKDWNKSHTCYVDHIRITVYYTPVLSTPAITDTTISSNKVYMTWTASSGTAPITYEFYLCLEDSTCTSTHGRLSTTSTTAGSSQFIAGQSCGTTWYWNMRATNSAGASDWSNIVKTTTPACTTVPAAPTGISATAGNAQATVSWTAPSDGGSPITGYRLYRKTGSAGTYSCIKGQNVTGVTNCSDTTAITAASYINTGLTNGTTYYYKVSAVNAVGEGTQSGEVSSTPVTVPGPPTNVSAKAGDGTATVTWKAPSSDGGSPITSYTVTSVQDTAKKATINCPCSTLYATVSDLTNGTSYTFKVTASNYSPTIPGTGTGPASDPSNPVTPYALKDPPCGNYGDVDNDGKVSQADADLILAFVAGSKIPTTEQTKRADVDGIVGITTLDLQVVLQYLSGALSTFPVCNVFDYNLSASPDTVSVSPGQSGSTIITRTLTTTSNSTKDITLAVTSTLPAGVTASFTNNPCSPSLTTRTCSSTLTLTTSAAAIPGLYPVTVSATPASTIAGKVTLNLVVASVPGAPTITNATAGDTKAWLYWSVPSDGGSTITSYTIDYSPAGTDGKNSKSITPDTTNCTASGCVAIVYNLANGTSYTFTVKATNAIGISSPSNSFSITIVTAPGAPTIGTATAGDGKATVSWTAPTSDGGSPITSYTATAYFSSTGAASGQSSVCSSAACTSTTITGLTNGTSYTFKVTASNYSPTIPGTGTGPASDPSNPVTPQAAFHYTLSAKATLLPVNPKKSVSTDITIDTATSSAKPVTLSFELPKDATVSGLPKDATASATPNPCSPKCISKLVVDTKSSTPLGIYKFFGSGSPAQQTDGNILFTLIVYPEFRLPPCLSYGNVDMDSENKITIKDVNLVKELFIDKTKTPTDEKEQTKRADVDGLPGVTIKDFDYIQNYLYGTLTKPTFPVCATLGVVKQVVSKNEADEKDIPLNSETVYYLTGNLTLAGNNTGTKSGVVFVEGNLNIDKDYCYGALDCLPETLPAPTIGTVFVVKGNVNIAQSVTRVDAVIIAGGKIYTAGKDCSRASPVASSQLIINGSFISLTEGSKIEFCRTLSDNTKPSEVINHQVKYLIILRELMSDTLQKWSEIP